MFINSHCFYIIAISLFYLTFQHFNCVQYIHQQLQSMQIRINLDQIFQGSRIQDNQSPSENKSYQYSQVNSYSSYNNRFKIDFPIFDDDDKHQQKIDKQPSDHQSKAASVTSMQTQFSQKLPGERLYYESMNNVLRKTKEMERLKLEKQKQDEKEITFKPKINKNSEKLASNKIKRAPIQKKQSQKIVPTKVKKQREQLMHCTFKPELIAKPKNITTRSKQQSQIFDQLFNDYKIKQVKQKLKTEGSEREKQKQKKLSKAELQSFLQRNNQFMSKVEKKKELILATSSKFDLQTGHKMFSPKTNSFKSHKNYFANSQSQTKLKPLGVIPKPLFQKNDDSPERTKGSIFNKNRDKQYDNMFILNSTEQHFSEIHEAKQDEEEEGIRQQSNFQTVKGFYFSTPSSENFLVQQNQEEQKLIKQIQVLPHFGSEQQQHQIKYSNQAYDQVNAADDVKQKQLQISEHRDGLKVKEIQQLMQEQSKQEKYSEQLTNHQGEDSRILNVD